MPVMVARTVSECFSDSVEATGFLVPRADAVVAMVLDGFEVVEVMVGEGDVVSERQPLVRLVRMGADQSTTQSGRPGSGSAGSGSGSNVVVLRAPAGGKIVSVGVVPGAVLSASATPLFRIAIDGVIEADAEVSSIYLRHVRVNQTAEVETEHGHELQGRVRAIGAEIDPVTQMGHVRISLDSDGPLRAGRFISARIHARKSCGLAVPRSAVAYTTDGTSVQVVRGDVIETVAVQVGLTSEHDAEIQLGLRAGELVVAHAGTSLRDGDRVSPVFVEEALSSTGQR